MSAVIVPFPSAQPTTSAGAGTIARQQFRAELHTIATSLLKACTEFDMLPAGRTGRVALQAGAASLEDALFHALTLSGCREEDRELRNLLNRRLTARETHQ